MPSTLIIRFLLFLQLFMVESISYADDSKEPMINGRPLNCSREAYNCPSYKGKYQHKTLKNCDDVKLVWSICERDVHDLDRDNDGHPCERDCDI
jgi:hypothetical protein